MVNGHGFSNPITLRRWHFLWVFIFDPGLTIETLWHHMASYENVPAEISPTMLPCLWCARWWSMTWGILRCSKGDARVVIFHGQRSTHSPMNRSVFFHIYQWWLWSNHIQPKLWCYGDWFGINKSVIFCHFVCHQWGSMILSSLCCRVSGTCHD